MLLVTFLIAMLGSILLFVIFIAMQPAAFRVTRGITIAAPPEAVFSQVNDLHKWEAWSPWEKMDPAMKKTYSGAPAGDGAVYEWAGNSKVGKGRMTVTRSQPGELVRMNLEMMKPMTANNEVDFTFVAQGDQTNVTWSMAGRKGFAVKAFSLFMNMDKMVGADFEKGLAQLKAVVESSGGVAASTTIGGR